MAACLSVDQNVFAHRANQRRYLLRVDPTIYGSFPISVGIRPVRIGEYFIIRFALGGSLTDQLSYFCIFCRGSLMHPQTECDCTLCETNRLREINPVLNVSRFPHREIADTASFKKRLVLSNDETVVVYR